MKKESLEKDIPRGTYRVADGQSVFDPADDSHVERTTPLKTKIKQQLSAEDAGINPEREASTRNKRAAKDTRPL